jgi:uncharacterized protein YqjF (DUF2071 family)
MSFLTAEWRKLALSNYAVDPGMLIPFLPKGTELDLWQGRCYVSLVGFMFVDTRLKGFPIPFHRNFEEVNLRFYVRRREGADWKRGVVFIKEIVPRAALTLVANWLYREHYQTMPMGHRWEVSENAQQVEYTWGKGRLESRFSVRADKESLEIALGSDEEFITEHYWGYTRVNADTTFEYEVRHPRWVHYPVKEYDIRVDFGALYGDRFTGLTQALPASVMLAEGSEVRVEGKRRLP